MAADLLQIVDDIKTSPTVLLDLNNESPFGAAEFDCPPPPLRYTSSSSMLADGSRISSSSYENRTLRIALDQISASQDAWATSWQTLARLIDQEWYWLKWQPTGATSPVFFRCYRSQVPSLETVPGATAYRIPTLEIPADPAAWGLPVDIASFTITNDPSTGTNKMMIGPSILGTIQGDLETPLLLALTASSTSATPGYVSSYALRGGFTHSFLARNLTDLTSGTDVGARVTAAGANYIEGDYKSCSFATTAMNVRLSGTFASALSPMPGLYRALVKGVVPDPVTGTHTNTYTFQIQFGGTVSVAQLSDPVTVSVNAPSGSTKHVMVDLGLVQIPTLVDPGGIGLAPAASAVSVNVFTTINASAANVSGSMQPFRFDELFLLPVDTVYGDASSTVQIPASSTTSDLIMYDGINDSVRVMDDTGTGTFLATPFPTSSSINLRWVGGLPMVAPGANNYLQVVLGSGTSGGAFVPAATTTWSGRYYPRYLHVRPAST
jgi:hypothetical protein